MLAFDYKAQQLRARRGLIKALLWLHYLPPCSGASLLLAALPPNKIKNAMRARTQHCNITLVLNLIYWSSGRCGTYTFAWTLRPKFIQPFPIRGIAGDEIVNVEMMAAFTFDRSVCNFCMLAL